MSWKPFFFDGNQWCGVVTPDKMADLLRAYTMEDILAAKIAPMTEIDQVPPGYHFGAPGVRTGEMPSFGYRREHTGDVTLGGWIERQGFALGDYVTSEISRGKFLAQQYLSLLDENNNWHNRSPFPKMSQLQAAEAKLREWAGNEK